MHCRMKAKFQLDFSENEVVIFCPSKFAAHKEVVCGSTVKNGGPRLCAAYCNISCIVLQIYLCYYYCFVCSEENVLGADSLYRVSRPVRRIVPPPRPEMLPKSPCFLARVKLYQIRKNT